MIALECDDDVIMAVNIQGLHWPATDMAKRAVPEQEVDRYY